jgi:SSS family solute:Na+ symporter
MQAWWLFVLCIVFYLIVSSYTKPRPLAEIQNLIFTKENSQGFKSRINSIKDPQILTGILLIIMIVLYVYFG